MSTSSECTCLFYEDDTYLHSILGIEMVDRLVMVIIYHRAITSTLVLFGLYYIITLLIMQERFFLLYLSWCLFASYSILWTSFALFSVNRTAFALIIATSSFWIKLLTAQLFVISYIFWNISIETQSSLPTMYLIYSSLIGTLFVLIVLYYSLIDGMQISSKSKSYFGFLLSIAIFIFLMQFLFFWNGDEYNALFVIEKQFCIVSWRSIAMSSCQTLCVFVSKQFLSSIVDPNKTAAITQWHRIEWTKSDKNNNKNEKISGNRHNHGMQSSLIDVDYTGKTQSLKIVVNASAENGSNDSAASSMTSCASTASGSTDDSIPSPKVSAIDKCVSMNF